MELTIKVPYLLFWFKEKTFVRELVVTSGFSKRR